MSVKILVITAGLREPSSTRLLGSLLANSTKLAFEQEEQEVEMEFVELHRYAHDITDALLMGFPNLKLQEVLTRLEESSGLIAVSPVFNSSFSGLFKSFFDILDQDALKGLPTLLGMTSGTKRHSLVLEYALKPMFNYLHAKVSPSAVFSATDDFGEKDLSLRITDAGREFANLVLKNPSRVKFEEFKSIDFAELLK